MKIMNRTEKLKNAINKLIDGGGFFRRQKEMGSSVFVDIEKFVGS